MKILLSIFLRTIAIALLGAKTYADDAIVANPLEGSISLTIQPTDSLGAKIQLREDLSMHDLGSPSRKRVFQVDVTTQSGMSMKDFHRSGNQVRSFDQVQLDLPGAGTFHVNPTAGKMDHWTGRSEDTTDYSEFFMKYNAESGQLIVLVNDAKGDYYKVHTRADGTTWMTVLKLEDRMEEQHMDNTPGETGQNRNLRINKNNSPEANSASASNFIPFADSGDVIDVMVVYTLEAMCDEALGVDSCDDSETNRAPIEALIQFAVDNNNIALEESQTQTQISLVHTYLEPDYIEPSSQSDALYELYYTNDGYMDNVHTIRSQYKADFVALILNSGSGVGFVNSIFDTAFSTTNKDYITGHTFAHELGHNLGCYHDRNNSGTQVSYAHGYQNVPASIRSILAYGCSSSYCQRVLRYSSPDINYEGNTIGTSTENCARKIRERRVEVANFFEGGSGTDVCEPITNKRMCNKTEGCGYNVFESLCKPALSTDDCTDWDGKKRKCKKNGCKWNNNTGICKGRWD